MKVSVIAPVYNTGPRITAFLDSMQSQTLDDMEIILVDDHGQDDSMAVAREYVNAHPSDKRFVFADSGRNLGPGGARNYGLALAAGQYIAFVDSDDTIEPDCCRQLYETAVSEDADLCFGYISLDYPDGHSRIKKNPAVRNGAFGTAEKKRYLRRYETLFTTYLYKRQMISDCKINFPNTRSAEDSCFLACSIISSQRIASVEKVFYRYHISSQSVSQKKDIGRWKERIASLRMIRQFVKEKNLYGQYFLIVNWLIFKKGWMLAIRDLIRNL